MHREQRDGLVVYRFESIPVDRVDVLVSTRAGGRSEPPYASLSLGLRVGDDPGVVVANRDRLFGAFGLSLRDSVWCNQVHANDVTVVTADDAGRGAFSEDDIVTDTDWVLKENPDLVNLKVLNQFEEFEEFRRAKGGSATDETPVDETSDSDKTPEERASVPGHVKSLDGGKDPRGEGLILATPARSASGRSCHRVGGFVRRRPLARARPSSGRPRDREVG